MKTIYLIATDLDGTLVGQGANADDYLEFRMILKKLRGGFNTRWAIVTGRHRAGIDGILGQFMIRGLFPDYLVLEDALIFARTRGGAFRPYRLWNFRVAWRRSAWRRRFQDQLAAWAQRIEQEFPGVEELNPDTVDLWYRFDSPETAARAERFVLAQASAGHEFQVYRWGRELFVGPAAGTKGEAVQRLCRDLGIRAAQVFAVGDGPNDISMLAPNVAGAAACVGNAGTRVAAAIREFGGYPARAPGIRGVIEALKVCVLEHPPPENPQTAAAVLPSENSGDTLPPTATHQ